MAQFGFNLTFTCVMLVCFPLILSYNYKLLVCHFTCDQNDTPSHENNISKFSKHEPRHKQTRTSRHCLRQTILKSFVQCVHTSTNG